MKAHVPFHYRVAYKPGRAINNRHAFFASEGTVEFRNVPREAVRTVMHAGKLASADGEVRAWHFDDPLVPRPDGGMREVVRFEGELWIEAATAADTIEGLEKRAGEGTPFLPRYSGEVLLKDVDNPNKAYQRPTIFTDRRQVERAERAPLRTFEDDGGEAMRRKLQRTADAFIEIDSMLYARFREPMLCIGGRYSPEQSIKFCGSRGDSVVSSATKYAKVDGFTFEEERAMAWSLSEEAAGRADWMTEQEREVAARLHAGQPADRKGLANRVRYEVLDPEILTACPHVESFLYLATAALKALWAHPLALRHGVLEQAVDLRDALAACGRQITPPLRRAVAEVSLIAPLSDDDAQLWRRRAAGRPRMKTHHGYSHQGDKLPLTRASQIVAHAGDHLKAVEFASRALQRLETRNRRLSWEERALETNSFAGDGAVSYELLSSQSVVDHAGKLGVRPEEAIGAARDEGARVFAVGVGTDNVVPRLIALVDEAPDGSLSVRSILHGRTPDPAAVELLERHLSSVAPIATVESEPCHAPGM